MINLTIVNWLNDDFLCVNNKYFKRYLSSFYKMLKISNSFKSERLIFLYLLFSDDGQLNVGYIIKEIILTSNNTLITTFQ